MVDVHSVVTRSYNMSQVRSKNTKPEIIVRKFLFSQGFRYRIHYKNLKGKPDIVFTKKKIVIFINGCFWHGHQNCKYFVVPKTKTQWWLDKIEQNKKNDKLNLLHLKKLGWTTIVITECELKKEKRKKTLLKLKKKLLE